MKFTAKPHRSRDTVKSVSANPDPVSKVEVTFELGREELLAILERMTPFLVPIQPHDPSAIDVQVWAGRFRNAVGEVNQIEYVRSSDGLSSAYLTSYDVRPAPNDTIHALTFRVQTPTDDLQLSSEAVLSARADSSFALQAAQMLEGRVYYFKAERLNVGEAPSGYAEELASDASNLPQCLNTLMGNPVRFERLNQHVREIFPEVEYITATLESDGWVRIRVWSIEPIHERADLAVPLSESGTGIGQVLAILYVVLTAEESKTIIIDEPQSFLHPGAIRKLFEILRHYERARHQYVITTHSPTVINAADPNALFVIHKEGEQSAVEDVDAATVRQQGRLLREVGATLSDVFGADDVLWVEGATEEECFPIIITKLLGRRLMGTRVVGVVHTSDFERKHARTALSIYAGLSERKGILPPTKGFIFDREQRPDKEREELEARSNGKATLTKRRTYENYLLSPRAIAAVASQIENFRIGEDVPAVEVEGWVEKHKTEAKYFDALGGDLTRNETCWLTEIHGAKFLEDMFFDLSGGRITYDKVEHGAAITRWLCENAREDLEEIVRLLEERLD